MRSLCEREHVLCGLKLWASCSHEVGGALQQLSLQGRGIGSFCTVSTLRCMCASLQLLIPPGMRPSLLCPPLCAAPSHAAPAQLLL